MATQALNIFGDHSDVMACRQTVSPCLPKATQGKVMDLSAVAHLSAIKGRVPFINFFDGFPHLARGSRRSPSGDYADLADMCDMDAVREFRAHALNPEHPAMRGSHENSDIFFQHREACNGYYDAPSAVVEDYMHQGQREARNEVRAVQLLRRRRRRTRDRGPWVRSATSPKKSSTT